MTNLHVPHWMIGDSKIYRQYDASRMIQNPMVPAYRFCFMEQPYADQVWNQEPKESWNELCVAHAHYLRQKWPKLKLFFSAGRDSGHLFRVFEQAGIPIDELVLPYSPYHPQRLREHVDHVLPIAKKLCARNPGMKIREVVQDKTWYDNLYKNSDWLEANAGQRSMMFTPYDWNMLIQSDPDYDSGQCGYMVGMDKPRIRLVDGNFVFQFLDTDIQFTAYGLPAIEYFYWAPEFPKLFIKQCWMLVRHFESMYPNCSPDFVEDFQKTKSGYYDEFCRSIGRGDPMDWVVGNGLNKIWNNYHWSVRKLVEYAEKEQWQCYKEYQAIVTYLESNQQTLFNSNDPLQGTVGIWGKSYFIKQQAKTSI